MESHETVTLSAIAAFIFYFIVIRLFMTAIQIGKKNDGWRWENIIEEKTKNAYFTAGFKVFFVSWNHTETIQLNYT